jgi:hypothetical protein
VAIENHSKDFWVAKNSAIYAFGEAQGIYKPFTAEMPHSIYNAPNE